VNDVGLHMYVVYMINDMVLNYFIENYNVLIWKSDFLRQTLRSMRIHCNWPVKRSCEYT